MAEYMETVERDADGCQRPIQASDDVEAERNDVSDISDRFNGLSIDNPSMHNHLPFDASDRIATSLSTRDYGTGSIYFVPRVRNQWTSDYMYPRASDRLQSDTPLEPQPPPRYPDYRDASARRQTFVTPQENREWPHPASVQDIDTLVRNGFFFTGLADLCRCYQCGIGLKDWTQQDDVLYIHLKYASHCHHTKRHADPKLIAIYKRQIEETNQNNGLSTSSGAGNQVRHPEYESYQVRISSFARWPKDRIQTPEQLAEAGFFFTGIRDVVRCYACDGGLQSWDSGDQPWIEHARWFPNCSHVLAVKGADYVQLVQQAVELQEENEFDTEDNPIANSETVYPLFSNAAKQVMDMGYSRAAVALAIEECKTKHLGISTETLLNVLLDKQEHGETLPEDPPRPESPRPPQFNSLTKEGLLEEREYLRSRLLCLKCQEKDCNILFLPCGHHKLCEKCAENVTECLICSAKVLDKIKTFMG